MKVLILGDGLLGSELHAQTGWDVGSRRLTNLDINNYDDLTQITSEYSCVVNCIAHTDSYSTDENVHRHINYSFAAGLSDICNNNSIKLVHISSEFVYAKNKKPPKENDLPQPDGTWYAYTKLLADEYIKLTSNNYLICRELHKPNPFPYPEVWDVKTSGDTVDKIANIIVRLIEKDAKGVFNVGTGGKNLSEIALDSRLIKPPLGIPTDTRMDLTKLRNFLKMK